MFLVLFAFDFEVLKKIYSSSKYSVVLLWKWQHFFVSWEISTKSYKDLSTKSCNYILIYSTIPLHVLLCGISGGKDLAHFQAVHLSNKTVFNVTLDEIQVITCLVKKNQISTNITTRHNVIFVPCN